MAKAKRQPRKGMSDEEMKRRYPSLKTLAAPPEKSSADAWVAAFRLRPDAMHAVLADLIKQVHATPGRIGQRPMPREEQVDFQALIFGDSTDEPITAVLPNMVKESERSFCQRISMSRAQYQRMLKGEYHPDAAELRLIAKALDKPPTFFLEYRMIMCVAAFINLIQERPGIATSLYREYLSVRMDWM